MGLVKRLRSRAASCPLCAGAPDRFGFCDRGHPALRVSGVTWAFRDHRDNLIVDPDAPVVAWRQEKGRRLGCENSHEALAWNVFRGLEVLGALPATLGPLFGADAGGVELRFWGRERDGAPWAPFADARAALEGHLRGPDVNAAEPTLVALLPAARLVVFVDAHLAAPLAGRPPRWFASAARPAEQRRRRALLEAMTGEEEDPRAPFRRGLAEVVRRGFYHQARRLLLARAVARRLGPDWAGRLVAVLNPRVAGEPLAQAARLDAQLAEPGLFRARTWGELWAAVPEAARSATGALRRSLADYLRSRTVNRAPARIIE